MIPTADEFWDKSIKDGAIEIMIDFAKAHVEAALKATSEDPTIKGYYEEWTKTKKGEEHKAELIMDDNDNYEGSYSGPVLSGGKVYIVDKESILSAYPLTLIK